VIGAFDVYGSPAFLALLLAAVPEPDRMPDPAHPGVDPARAPQPPAAAAPPPERTGRRCHDRRCPAEVLDPATTLLARAAVAARTPDTRRPPDRRREGPVEPGGRQPAVPPQLLRAPRGDRVRPAADVRGPARRHRGRARLRRHRGLLLDLPARAMVHPRTTPAGASTSTRSTSTGSVTRSRPGPGNRPSSVSDVTITPADGEPFAADVEGNRPLVIDGMKIHQLDWGYAPGSRSRSTARSCTRRSSPRSSATTGSSAAR
jgi:hypothetical protein